jgi:hypothetical protein
MEQLMLKNKNQSISLLGFLFYKSDHNSIEMVLLLFVWVWLWPILIPIWILIYSLKTPERREKQRLQQEQRLEQERREWERLGREREERERLERERKERERLERERKERERLEWERIERKRLATLSSLQTLRALSPQAFENEVAKMFRRMGYAVEQTPYVNDHGRDAIMTKNGKKIILECKRYADGQTSVDLIYRNSIVR